ncbi:nicotinamide phosphoribosyltransferase [Yersinia phage vB_YenM_P778]
MTSSLYAVPAALNADAYKSGHKAQYPEGMTAIMQNMTPRSDKYFDTPLTKDGVIFFGLQRFCKDYLVDHWNASFFNRPKDEAVSEALMIMNGMIMGAPVQREHWEALHDLGYLPVAVDALPEGTLVPMKVPMFTFQNTNFQFAWVAGYLEDAFSNENWKATTIATIAFHYKRILTKWADKNCDDRSHIPYQAHDFSLRGLSGMNDGAFNSMGHLTSFMGTDNFAAVYTAKRTYAQSMEVNEIACTIAATEHTVMCANIALERHGLSSNTLSEDELLAIAETKTMNHLLTEVYPTGFLSVVGDTNDYWHTIGTKLANLRDIIVNRDGKLVVRPDSGIPYYVICGYKAVEFENAKALILRKMDVQRYGSITVESIKQASALPSLASGFDILRQAGYELIVEGEDFDGANTLNLETSEIRWMTTEEINGSIRTFANLFGTTNNSKGFKVLPPYIGLIYGDSITMKLADKILGRLDEMGFAASNVVFGVGSFTYQFITRDTFGFAVKGTACETSELGYLPLAKDPITDRGLKKSAKGCTQVVAGLDGKPKLLDGLNFSEYEDVLWSDGVEVKSLLKPIFIDSRILEQNFQTLKEIRDLVDSQL